MTLDELSREYEHSAQLLRDRLKELRQLLKQTDDPEERWQINRRIQDLTPMLTEAYALAELTRNYYQRGHYRDERYSSNCFRGGEQKRNVGTDLVADFDQRADGSPEGYGSCVLSERNVSIGLCRKPRGKQINRISKFECGNQKNKEIYQIHPRFSASDFGRLMGAIWDETDRKEK